MLGHLRLLQSSGPALGRPHVDTLNGSRFANMKGGMASRIRL
ncbi:hypothetical protein ACIPW4_07125 [Pseudomonas sp. NPDC089996]